MNISLTERANLYSKATRLVEIDNAVQFDIPISAGHEFFVDFADVRGDFEDKLLYKALNISPINFSFNHKVNQVNKVLLFLAGMRGSGKTSELLRITDKLNHKDAFFCVFCNLDVGLNIDDMEYMDILVFQLECLFEELEKRQVTVDNEVVGSMQKWFSQRIEEINHNIQREAGFEIEIKAETPSIFSFLKVLGKLKANLKGSKGNATKIRTVFKNNFADFALKINEFFNHVATVIREKDIARELLFVVDGLEKVGTPDVREAIVNKEDYFRQIQVNTIFTLPIELMRIQPKLISYSEVISFPFVKIKEKNNDLVPQAIERFEEFVYKRIDISLFDKAETVKNAVIHSGGSPRELLRILKYANIYANDEKGFIDEIAMNKALKKLAAQSSHYVSQEDLNLLKTLKQNNEKNIPTAYGEEWQDLLENLIIMEYNDGTYKRVNPLVEASELYQYYVIKK